MGVFLYDFHEMMGFEPRGSGSTTSARQTEVCR